MKMRDVTAHLIAKFSMRSHAYASMQRDFNNRRLKYLNETLPVGWESTTKRKRDEQEQQQ